MQKLFVVITIIVLILIGGFLVLNNYIYQQKQAGSNESITTYRGELTGEYVCLPPKNTSGPQTLECAFGIKTDAEEYYTIDFTLMSQERPELIIGDRFSASGNITPIELLSTNHWQKYDIRGIFTVTDSVQKL